MKSYIVAGMEFGDEGKGSIVDFIASNNGIKNNIRFNGGNQAAHHVTREGVTHCFSQFGSSMFSPDTKTILSEHVLMEPYSLENEANVLIKRGFQNIYSRLFIDPKCLVVTPIHKIINQMKEEISHIGSCGLGVSEAVLDSKLPGGYSLRAGDLCDISSIVKKLDFLWRVKLDFAEQLFDSDPKDKIIKDKFEVIKNMDIDKISKDYINISNNLFIENVDKFFSEPSVYEGAQGMLLDVESGFHPYVTKTVTTFKYAETLCKTPYEKVGVIRPYITRHGDGPLPTRNVALENLIPDNHNKCNSSQGDFRIGWQDLVLMKYAVGVSDPDYIAMTNVDRANEIGKIKLSTSYKYFGNENVEKFFEYKKVGRLRYILSGIKKDNVVGNGNDINRILNKCKPIYKEFDNHNNYFKFLESGDGINIPIKILSFGPESKDKKIIFD